MATATKPQAQVTASSPDAPGPAGLDAMIAQATADYRELVRRHAQGELDDERIDLEVLSRDGRSLVQFQADSERLRKRLAAAVQLDNPKDAQEEIKTLRGCEADLKKEMQRLADQYYAKAAELEQKLGAVRQELLRKQQQPADRSAKALNVLHETAPLELLEQLRGLRIANSEAERYKMLAKQEARGKSPPFQKRAEEEQDACIRRIQELNAQLHDPFQGMAWE
jgi:hypothetical protein